jgi:8-oxo-dGTP diphosphatase
MTHKLSDEDRKALEDYDPRIYLRPSSSVDVVIFTIQDDRLKVLLSRRKEPPFRGLWGFPGGFIDPGLDASLEACAHRTLAKKARVKTPYLEQLQTYGDNARDPRDWVLTVVYFALVPYESISNELVGNEAEAKLFTVVDDHVNQRLAFDHKRILKDAVRRLRNKLEYTAIAVHLLGEEFTIPDLYRVYQIGLNDDSLDRSSFHARILKTGLLHETGREKLTGGRPSMLYRFASPGAQEMFFPRSLVYARRRKQEA